jgi:hypothetical protein
VLLLLLACVSVAYANVVFLGRSLVNTDNWNPLDPRARAESHGPGFVPHTAWIERNLLPFANFHDPGGPWWQWEPAGEFLRRGLRRGEWPWWDPYVAAGAPAMANLTSAFFFPPSALVVLLGNGVRLKNAYFLALLLAAGYFTYLFLRRHALGREASLLGALAVMFCGGLAQNVGALIGQAVASLPVALHLTRRFLESPSWTRVAALAAGYAAIALASFPPVLVALFGVAALYALVMAARADLPWGGLGRVGVALRFGAAVALALGLVAFYYLPAAYAWASAPQVAELYRDAGREALPVTALYQLASPTLLGGSKVLVSPPAPVPWIDVPYVGMVPIVVALLADGRAGGPLFGVVLAALAVSALKLVGAAPVQWIAALPGLNALHFHAYLGMVLDVLVALLAALGLENLRHRRVGPSRAVAALVLGGLAVWSLRSVAVAYGALRHPAAAQWLSAWWWVLALTLATGLALLAGTVWRERPALVRSAVGVVLLLALVEGIANTAYPRQRAWDVWRHPVPYVRQLAAEAGLGRVFGIVALPANAGSAFEIASLDSLMAVNPPRTWALYRRYFSDERSVFMRESRRVPPESVLDRANIEHVAVREEFGPLVQEMEQRGYATRFRDGYVRLFRRPSTPRYYFTSEYRVMAAAEGLEALGGLAAGREVVLEAAPAFAPVPNDPADPPVEVRAFGRNRYTLGLAAPRPGLVYCSESDFPGWTVRVNGRPGRIVPANVAFRAVEVPAGAVTLEFEYWPPGLTAGLGVSGASAGLAGLLVVADRRRRVPAAPAGREEAA